MTVRWPRLFAAISLAAVLAACATTTRIGAAGDVHALLVAIRDDDRAAFDAHVDRPALEAEMQARIIERARNSNAPNIVKGFGVVVSGPLSRAAGAAVLRPEVLRGIAEYYGYRPGQPIPGVLAIASALETLPDGRVCAVLRRRGLCVLTFADEDGVWRLVDFDLSLAAHDLKAGA